MKSKRVIPPAHWRNENTEHLLLLIWDEIKRHPNTFEVSIFALFFFFFFFDNLISYYVHSLKQKPTAQQFYFKISEKCPQFETTNWVSMKNKLENCKIHYRRTRNLLGKADITIDTGKICFSSTLPCYVNAFTDKKSFFLFFFLRLLRKTLSLLWAVG